MADPVRTMPLANQAPQDRTGEAPAATGAGFGDALAARTATPFARHVHHAPHAAGRHAGHGPHDAAHDQARHVSASHHPSLHRAGAEKAASVIPVPVQHALVQAMRLEQVPASWHAGLQFIVAQESAGQVGARNHVDSARGLFQLTRASYNLNPNGAGSFGNAVEEAQGGIRYIRERYGTADNAVGFWRQRRWY